MNIEKYKDIRENSNIDEIKEKLSKLIIQDIVNNDVDLDEISMILGISVEKLSKIILEVKKSTGSELVLVSAALDKVLKKTTDNPLSKNL